jgi:hypothetical protein
LKNSQKVLSALKKTQKLLREAVPMDNVSAESAPFFLAAHGNECGIKFYLTATAMRKEIF